MNFDYSSASYSVRPDLPESYRKVWAKISESGNHWHAVDKIAIAAESRVARQCQFCHERKAALSLYALKGKHQVISNLPATAIDAVHRITTDASRITEQWIKDQALNGLSIEKYIELLGVVVAAISIDAFHRAKGLP
jgi:hypothetical protein